MITREIIRIYDLGYSVKTPPVQSTRFLLQRSIRNDFEGCPKYWIARIIEQTVEIYKYDRRKPPTDTINILSICKYIKDESNNYPSDFQ